MENILRKENFPRHGFFILFLFIVLFFLSLSVVVAAGQRAPFRWVDDDDYSPFIYKGSDGRPAGFYKDLMVEIFKRLNIPLQGEVYPWKRAQKYAEEGIADGMITTLTKERKALFVATAPLFINCERVFARRDNPRIKEIMAVRSIKDLKPYKIVETIGSGWAEEHFKGLDVVWAPSYTSALDMLANGRVDIYILGHYPGMADIASRINKKVRYSEKLKKIIVGRNSLAEIPFCLLIRKTSEYVGIIPQFNNVLEQMKQSGTYQALLKKYFAESMKIPEGKLGLSPEPGDVG